MAHNENAISFCCLVIQDNVCLTQFATELDTYYARLCGLTRDELRYILDPKEVYGEDFPGETFRMLKEKEVRLYRKYRIKISIY